MAKYCLAKVLRCTDTNTCDLRPCLKEIDNVDYCDMHNIFKTTEEDTMLEFKENDPGAQKDDLFDTMDLSNLTSNIILYSKKTMNNLFDLASSVLQPLYNERLNLENTKTTIDALTKQYEEKIGKIENEIKTTGILNMSMRARDLKQKQKDKLNADITSFKSQSEILKKSLFECNAKIASLEQLTMKRIDEFNVIVPNDINIEFQNIEEQAKQKAKEQQPTVTVEQQPTIEQQLTVEPQSTKGQKSNKKTNK